MRGGFVQLGEDEVSPLATHLASHGRERKRGALMRHGGRVWDLLEIGRN